MSPVVSEEPDFIVVDRLQSLIEMQENMKTGIQRVKTRLACLEIRMASIERESHINMYLRRVMLSFAAAATPVLLSIMLGQNMPPPHSPMIDCVTAISKVLLAFAACVGIPLLIQSLTDLLEAQSENRLVSLSHSHHALTNTAAGDSSDTCEEPEEDEEDSDEDDN